MALDRLTKIAGPGIKTDTNWVGNNANFTGVTTTASSFNVGVTTIHSTLIEAHNIKSTGIITATGGSFSGNVTAVDGTFSGNVSIAGTLTYEDVTSIDSVGIITGKGADINGDLDVDGHTNLDNVSVAGVSTFNDNVRLLDGDRLQFGNSQDISIFHNGSHTLINKSGSGTGDLIFNVDQVTFKDTTGTDERLATNSKGIKVGTGVTIETNGQATFAGVTTFTGHSQLFDVFKVGASGSFPGATEGSKITKVIKGSDVRPASLTFDHGGSATLEIGSVTAAAIIGTNSHGANNKPIRFMTGMSIGTLTGGSIQMEIKNNAVNIFNDLDVDGHTNLDNVSIAGVTTITGTGGNGLLKVERASGAGLHIQAQSTLGVFGTTSNHNLRIISNGNERMMFLTNGNVGINESSPSHKLVVGGDIGIGFNTPNDAGRQLNFNVNRSSAGDTLANINWQWNNKYVAQIRGIAGADTTNKDDGHLAFFTSAANSLVERLRIDSSGRVMIGTTTEGVHTADDLTIAAANGVTGITLRSGTGSAGNIFFSDGTSGDDEFRGFIQYYHADNSMRIATNNTTRIHITSAGAVMVNKSSSFGTVPLQVKGASSGLSDGGQIFDIGTADGSSGTRLAFGVSEDNFGWIRSYESGVGGRDIVFAASDEKMRITSDNRVLIGRTASRMVGGSLTYARLQVAGTSQSSSSLSLVNNEASAAAPFVFFGKSRGTSVGSSTAVTNGDTLGGLSFIGADGSDLNNRTAEITAVVNGTVQNNVIPTNLVFTTSAQNATQLSERLRIYNTNTGNGGIAKFTSPASGDMLNLQNETASGQGLIFGVDTSNDYTYMRNNTSGTYSMVFNVNGSERVRINPSGKLGIGFNFNYTMNTDSTNLVIGDGGGAKGITLWTASGADSQNISFQVNETLSRAEGEISYGPSGCSTVANRNAMMFRVNSAERLRITSTGNTRIGVPPTTGSSSLISEKQATIGTKHFYTVYHNFSSTNSPLAVNSKIPHPACGTVEIMAGWANGNGMTYKKFYWASSGNVSGCSQLFSTGASRYGVSTSVGTPTMSISGDYTNFSFTFSDGQGAKMEKLKIHFEYFNQFRIDG